MLKRKKHPRLPSGWGSIRYLGSGRRNCYAVHPPATECYPNGHYIQPKAICYVPDWYTGFAVLNSWRAGTYKPGDEIALAQMGVVDDKALDGLVQRILKDAALASQSGQRDPGKTFADVYRDFYEWKYGEHAPKKLSECSRTSTASAYRNLSALHGVRFRDIRLDDMQRILDECPLKEASVELMLSLLKQMYNYADARELCDKDYSRHLVLPAKEGDEHGVPFTREDLRTLWENRSDDTVGMILIMCYSGFRISAYRSMEVSLPDGYFKGGVKTKSGKDRIVPIHSAILPLVEDRIERHGCLLPVVPGTFTKYMKKALPSLGIQEHTPHDCRHTFSALCEKYNVNENDRKRMLGHSFGNDITNGVYGHRSLEDLRREIEKIKPPYDL